MRRINFAKQRKFIYVLSTVDINDAAALQLFYPGEIFFHLFFLLPCSVPNYRGTV